MLKVGIIGAGFMGDMHSNCYANLRNAKVTAVADARPDKCKAIADVHGAQTYADGLELVKSAGVDAVDICLPTYMHCTYTCAAAKAGLHVLCEKPMALSVKECNAMIAAAKKAKRTLMIAQVLRFWPEYVVLKDYVTSKKLGKLLSLSLTRVSPRPDWAWQSWMADNRKSGSAAIDLHLHDTDTVRFMLGDPKGVDSVATVRNGLMDHIFTNYHYDEVAVTAAGGWDFGGSFPFMMGYLAVFEKGALDFDCRRDPSLILYPVKGTTPRTPKLPKPKVKGTGATGGNISELGGYFLEIKYFVDCVTKGQKPSIVMPEDSRDTLALVLKEVASAARKLKK